MLAAEPSLVYGIHPVLELIELRGAEIERVYVSRAGGPRLGRLLRRAREKGIPVSHVSPQVLAKRLGARASHQGVAAQVALVRYAEVEELCRAAAEQPAALLVLVDGVEDPGNLGAILRTSAAAGVAGIILSREGTVGLTPAVAKVSAGAIERIPVAREARPGPRLRSLAAAGFTTCLLDPRSDHSWDRLDLRGRSVLVAGGEERGARPGVARACESRVAIPLARGVESLNVAVALGVLLFEAVRQRRLGQGSS